MIPIQPLTVAPGAYRLSLINAVPGRRYWLVVGPSVAQKQPVLPQPDSARLTTLVRELSGGCKDATTVLTQAEDEAGAQHGVERVRQAIASGLCTGDEATTARALIEMTRIAFVETPIILEADSVRVVRIFSDQAMTNRSS